MVDLIPTPSFAAGRAGFYLRIASGKVSIWCPKCGQFGSLGDHDIAADGTVTPSVECPMEGCGFHGFVRLVGWEGEGRTP